ncbi:MAG: hypothetical protein DRI34_11995 [Deltaproteobacteria bacterium]|nr:MAG: hypothetical protein DRI34_11995 [Deltaproteobacteria bacterium]
MSGDDYRQILERALENGDDDKVLAAFRVLDTTARLEHLPATVLARLAQVLQRQRLFLEAASALRLAAQKAAEPEQEAAAGWLLRAACLLLGSAARPELGRELARRLAAEPDGSGSVAAARHLLTLLDTNNHRGLRRFFEQQGLEPPADTAAGDTPAPAEQRTTSGAASFLSRQREKSWVTKLLPGLLVLFLAAWLSGLLLRDRLGGVTETRRELLAEPRQAEIAAPRPVQLRHGDWNLVLRPRFSYHICGLVVHVNTYAMLGLRFQDFYERDLCMVWGENVSSRAFQAPGTSFTHHGNTCFVHWSGPIGFRMQQLSNTHVFSLDEKLRAALARIRAGDQVCLDGKLVDVSAVPRRAPAGTMPAPVRLKTSTTRTDTGNGACEIMLVERLQVLARANRFWRLLNGVGFWGAMLLALLWLGNQLLRR